MIVAGSNLGGTAGYVMNVPVPSRTILFGTFFIWKSVPDSQMDRRSAGEKGRLTYADHDRKDRKQT